MLETITWLWEPWIPNSALTLVCGEPAKGKSTLLAHLAAGVTTRPFASRRNGIRPATVLWIHGEESWGCATLPRLKAAGADPTRVIHPDQAGDLTQRITVGQLSADLPGLSRPASAF